jgi:FMN phosphatase YigB (HAD superfamily)
MTEPRQTRRAIICDIGGVLTAPPVQAAAEFLAGYGLSLDDVAAAIFEHSRVRGRNPLVELELGRIDEAAFLAAVAEALGLDRDPARFLAGFSDHYFGHLELNHELLDRLGAARAHGVALAILSNNARDWHERWRARRSSHAPAAAAGPILRWARAPAQAA